MTLNSPSIVCFWYTEHFCRDCDPSASAMHRSAYCNKSITAIRGIYDAVTIMKQLSP